jgi:hypothetical protein
MVGRGASRRGGPAGEWDKWASPRASWGPFAESLALGEANFNKKTIEIADKSEKIPTLNMTLDMVCIAYKKVVVVKLKVKFL